MEKRKIYLDAAKGIAILMVMFGHITDIRNPVEIFFNSVKLAIFFIASGWIMSMKESVKHYSLRIYLKKRVNSLLVPYFGYSVIIILFNIGLCLLKGSSNETILNKFLEQSWQTISGRGISAMWFLPALFLGEMIFYMVVKSNIVVKIISAGIPLVTTYWGYMFLQNKDTMDRIMFKMISYPLHAICKGILAFWFIGCGYILFSIVKYVSNKYIRGVLGAVLLIISIVASQYNVSVDLNNLKVGDYPMLFYMGSVVGSLGIFLVLEFLEHWWKMRIFSYCGRHSLIIMATHGTLQFKGVVIAGWHTLVGSAMAQTVSAQFYLDTICILIELMLMECGVITIIENYFPWLAGKFKGFKRSYKNEVKE